MTESGLFKHPLRRFNRDTEWLATEVLAATVFAALVFAVLVQERHPKADDLTEEARQTTGDISLNANPAAISDVVDSNEKSNGKITSGQATSVDRGLTPEINHLDVQANARSWSPAHRQDSFVRFSFVDVKMRLIALWHQSLARNEKSRTWTAFSNSNKWERRKVGYTAETYH